MEPTEDFKSIFEFGDFMVDDKATLFRYFLSCAVTIGLRCKVPVDKIKYYLDDSLKQYEDAYNDIFEKDL